MDAYQRHPRLSHRLVISVDQQEEDLKLEQIQEMIDEDMFIYYIHYKHFCNWLAELMDNWMNAPGDPDKKWRLVIFSETTFYGLRALLARNLEARIRNDSDDEEEARLKYYELEPFQLGYCPCGTHYNGIPGEEREGAGGGQLA